MSIPVPLEGFGSGGGAALNFKVVAYASEEALLAATPAENTIGVITTNKITGYSFSAEALAEAVEGMVWFNIGTSSQVAFSATKKNPIMVYPLSAKQYVDGALGDVTCWTYQNGAWVEWATPGLLYDSGNENIGLTGGWVAGTPVVYNSSFTLAGSLDMSIDDSGLLTATETVANGNSVLYMKNPIDLSNYSTLKFTGSYYSANSLHCMLGIWTEFGVYKDDNIAAKLSSTSTSKNRDTYVVDVSKLSGPHMIGFYMFGTSSSQVTMQKMWLE